MQEQVRIATVWATTLLVGLWTVGCGDDDDPSVPPGSSVARIEGTVSGDDTAGRSGAEIGGAGTSGSSLARAAGVEGAVVTLARLQADGELEATGAAEVMTDVDGRFAIETDIDGESGLVVVARKESDEWWARVSGSLEHGAVTACPPVGVESTGEADVFAHVIAAGHDEAVSYPMVQTYVDASLAAGVAEEPDLAADLAATFDAAAEARVDWLTGPLGAADAADLEVVSAAEAEAQVRLESALLAAEGDPAAEEAAVATYFASVADAYTSAGLGNDAYAWATEANARTALAFLDARSTASGAALLRQAARVRARSTTNALDMQFAAVGASGEVRSAVAEAAASLLLALQADTATESEIDAAFDVYHDEVVAGLRASLVAWDAQIEAIDVAVNGPGGARSNLETALVLALDPSVVAGIYDTYFLAVEAATEAVMTTATQAEIDATAQVLALASVYGS